MAEYHQDEMKQTEKNHSFVRNYLHNTINKTSVVNFIKKKKLRLCEKSVPSAFKTYGKYFHLHD